MAIEIRLPKAGEPTVMTLDELKKKKGELEETVSKLLTDFQNETGAARIDMTFAKVPGNKREQPFKILVHAEVTL